MANVSEDPDAALLLLNTSTPTLKEAPGVGSAPETLSLAATVICVLILSLMSVFGAFGNILVLLAFFVNKHLQNVRSAFIINMAVADLLVTLIANPFSIVGKLKGAAWFDARPGLCDVLAALCTLLCVTSLLSLAGVCVNRYVHICHFRLYDRIFTLRKTILMCFFCWVISGALVVPNFVGWGDLTFDPKSLECIFDRTADYSYTAFFMSFLVGPPVMLITYSFVRIYLKVRKTRIQLEGHGTKSSRVDSVKLSKTLFVVFIFFTICWMPFVLTHFIDRPDMFPPGVYVWIAIQAHFHSSFNGILYFVTNLNFRKAYVKVLCLDQWYSRRRVSPGNQTTSQSANYTSGQVGTVTSTLENTVRDRTKALDGASQSHPNNTHSTAQNGKPAGRET